ncbi:hypothetical protein Tco_1175109 [Tanacetum coccineum]
MAEQDIPHLTITVNERSHQHAMEEYYLEHENAPNISVIQNHNLGCFIVMKIKEEHGHNNWRNLLAPLVYEDDWKRSLRFPTLASSEFGFSHPLKILSSTMNPNLENEDFSADGWRWTWRIGSSMAGAMLKLQSTEVPSYDRKEYGLQRKTTYLEGVKEEDLMVTMAGAIEIKINNLNLELEKAVKERDELKNKIAKWEESAKNLDEILKSQLSARDKTGLGYSTQLNELSSNHETDSENSFSVFDGRSSDEDSTPANDRSSKVEGYKAVPPPITGNFLTPRVDISFAGLDEYAIRNKIIESQTSKLNNETSETTGQTNDANTVKPKSASKPVVSNLNKDRLIIEDWYSDDEEELSEVQTVRPETQTVKTRDDKSEQDLSARPVSTARPICTTRPSISTVRLSVSTARPVYERPRGSCSPIKRSYYTRPVYKPKDLKHDVQTFRIPNMNTVGKRALVNTDSGSFMLKKGNPEILLQDHAVVDSGCSSHMTSNKAYLSDYEDFNGGFVAFGSDPKGDELKFNLFSVSQMCDKKNSVLFTESECLILSPSFKLLDESQVVLRAPRKDDVYSLDLKNIVPSGEAVNTACYVLNRVLVTKPQNKTPYELLIVKLLEYTTKGLIRVVRESATHFLERSPKCGKELELNVGFIRKKIKGPTQEYILLPLQPHRIRIPVKDVVQDAQEKPSENASSDKDV